MNVRETKRKNESNTEKVLTQNPRGNEINEIDAKRENKTRTNHKTSRYNNTIR